MGWTSKRRCKAGIYPRQAPTGATHRPNSSNNILGFIESTLESLGNTTVGLFRADSGFHDKTIVALLNAKGISHIISARLT